MAFIKNNMILMFFFITIMARSSEPLLQKLPELSTKQSINKLRYISTDGKLTYYQNQEGDLFFATNYSTEKILKGENAEHHLVQVSKKSQTLLIQSIPQYHSSSDKTASHKLHVGNLNGEKIKDFGEGVAPFFHINGKWISYYIPRDRTLTFKNVENPNIKFDIILNSALNPFFIPERVMISDHLILYTDINDKGEQGLILYHRFEKKFVPLYKTIPGQKIEVCHYHSGNIIVGQFGYYDVKGTNIIFKAQVNSTMMKLENNEILYQSELNDLGHMICRSDSHKIYFIKTYKSNALNIPLQTDVAELGLKDKKLKKITDLNDISNIILMDERILIPYQGNYLVLEGSSKTAEKSLETLSTSDREK